MPEAVTVAEAARALGTSEQTVRNWLARGAPCVRPGSAGRGRGALVDPAALRSWRNREEPEPAAEQLEALAKTLLNVFHADGALEPDPLPAWQSLGLRRTDVAAVLLLIWRRAFFDATGELPTELPAELQALFGVLVESRRLNR